MRQPIHAFGGCSRLAPTGLTTATPGGYMKPWSPLKNTKTEVTIFTFKWQVFFSAMVHWDES